MAVKQTDRSFLLNVEQIDIASEQIFDFLCKLKLEHKEAMRIRLNAENILLSWQTRFGANCVVHLSCYVRLGQPLIYLRTEGEPFDPLDAEVDELDAWKNALLAQMETQAHYTYSRGCNTVTFRIVKPKRSPLVLLLISLAAAIVFGLAGILLPNHIRDILADRKSVV